MRPVGPVRRIKLAIQMRQKHKAEDTHGGMVSAVLNEFDSECVIAALRCAVTDGRLLHSVVALSQAWDSDSSQSSLRRDRACILTQTRSRAGAWNSGGCGFRLTGSRALRVRSRSGRAGPAYNLPLCRWDSDCGHALSAGSARDPDRGPLSSATRTDDSERGLRQACARTSSASSAGPGKRVVPSVSSEKLP